MKKILLLLAIVTAFPATAEVPKTRPLAEYYHLWRDSPFTVKPEVEETEKTEENELDDYVLLGVEVTPHGKLVVVRNVEDDSPRFTISTWDGGKTGFKILEVEQDPNKSLSTRVLLEKGSHKGWVSYDPQYLTLKSTAAHETAKKKDNNRRRNRNSGKKKSAKKKEKKKAKPRVKFVDPNKK